MKFFCRIVFFRKQAVVIFRRVSLFFRRHVASQGNWLPTKQMHAHIFVLASGAAPPFGACCAPALCTRQWRRRRRCTAGSLCPPQRGTRIAHPGSQLPGRGRPLRALSATSGPRWAHNRSAPMAMLAAPAPALFALCARGGAESKWCALRPARSSRTGVAH